MALALPMPATVRVTPVSEIFGRMMFAAAAPAARGPAAGRRLVRSLVAIARQTGAAPAPRPALIVVDDARQRRFCETVLQALGVTTDVAAAGAQALQALERRSFGLVILDASAPDIDADFWRRLEQLFERRETPTFYLITDPEGRRPDHAPRLAAVRAIPRPVRALNLVEAAQRLRRT